MNSIPSPLFFLRKIIHPEDACAWPSGLVAHTHARTTQRGKDPNRGWVILVILLYYGTGAPMGRRTNACPLMCSGLSGTGFVRWYGCKEIQYIWHCCILPHKWQAPTWYIDPSTHPLCGDSRHPSFLFRFLLKQG